MPVRWHFSATLAMNKDWQWLIWPTVEAAAGSQCSSKMTHPLWVGTREPSSPGAHDGHQE
jgi:hypothetical protein